MIGGGNWHGLYAVHQSGAHVALVDNSVQFLNDALDTKVRLALMTRRGAETVDTTDVF